MDVLTAGGRLAHGADDLGVRSLLEHVAARARREGLAHVTRVVLHREHEHLRLGRFLEELRQRFDPALARHHDVEQHDVGLVRPHLEDRFTRVARLADDLEVVLGVEEHAQARADDGVVVDDDDAYHAAGTSATIVVPAPGDDSTWSRPSRSATRSRIPERPRPPSRPASSGTKPWPSSSITAVTDSPRRTRRMLTRRAPACLATFVSASCTIR